MRAVPLKRVASVTLGKMLQNEARPGDKTRPYLKASSISEDGEISRELQEMPFSPQERSALTLQARDTVVVEGGSIGRSAYLSDNLDGVHFQNSINRIRPFAGHSGRFIRYSIESLRGSGYFDAVTNQATIRHLTAERLGEAPIAVLPTPAQGAIADYLDHETAEIDKMLNSQQAAIDLLSVRWSSEVVARIHEGVRDPALVSSEVPTWPNAPKHWRRTRLKSTIKSAKNGAWGGEPGEGEISVRCIRVADFDKTRGSIHERNTTERSFPVQVVRNIALQPGDLLLEKSGGGPTTPVGNVVLYEGPGGEMYSNFVARLELSRDIDPLYALYLHQGIYYSGVTQRSIKQTTGIQNLDAEAYFNEPIFLPALNEQQEIGTHLRSRRAELDTITADLTRAITLAKERRAALITAAVTGQIDVTAKHRPAAEQLEDDIKELS